ncbi:MAG: phosphoribosylaminoimidazolesuccinocarboxamide synthase [Puniceicoccaceae bacterium MED-G31]|nr:MAG: phosphoribosylaminoimidazolesuccinocarboxamide synthase [Puniceicoccaceae bacterium MED-G31]|tara:strand:+ start:17875 stop:18783 length:909 start_codon:yes stop_codon:yes gene_type:complete
MPSIDFPFELPREAMLTVGDLPFPKVASGKVREIYDMGDALLMVATDRVSAFDVVMNEGLAGKGALLTQISLYWFEQANRIMAHHLVDNHSDRLDSLVVDFPDLKYRSMIVKKLKPLPIEAVVRGYLSGSGWKSYEQSGKLFEYELPQNLVESSRLKIPLFTPTTKAATGHDMPVDCIEAAKLIGSELFNKVHALSLKLYAMGAAHSQKAKIILADTKFEFGTDKFGDLYLIDEVLTPDSSRYWPMDNYAPGGAQPSYDKQFIRDFLEKLDWDKSPPPPKLPNSVLQGTLERYKEAYISLIT